MRFRCVLLATVTPLCFAAVSAGAGTPCPLPEKSIKEHLVGSGGIEVIVTAPVSYTVRVLEVSSEVFRPTAECIAEHADLLFHAKMLEPGTWDIPIDFCSNPEVATCPSSARGWQHNGQVVK